MSSAVLSEAAAQGDLQQLERELGRSVQLVNTANDRGWTPLHFAARFNQVQAVVRLLHAGADANLRDLQGKSPLDLADFFGHTEVSQMLRKHLNLDQVQEQQSVTVNLGGNHVVNSNPDGKVFVTMPAGTGGASIVANLEQHTQFFAGNPLKRHSEKRPDQAWIESAMKASNTRFLVFKDGNVLISKKDGLITLPYRDVAAIVDVSGATRQQWIYLGSLASEAWFAVDVTKAAQGTDVASLAQVIKTSEGLASFESFRPAAFKLSKEQAAIASTARSVLDWNLRHPFCPACGAKTVSADAGYRRQCTSEKDACPSHHGVQNYSHPRTDPVIITAVVSTDGNRIMLGRNKKFPPKFFSCVAGFMEPGESIEECVKRECKEELGVEIGRIMYHSSQPWPFPAQLMIGCVAVATTEKFEPEEDELAEARWFTKAEITRSLQASEKIDLRSDASGRLMGGFQGDTDFFLAPAYAIAHQLIKAWSTGEVDVGNRPPKI